MKKNILLLLLLNITISSFAQYKKASFFNKEGRTHELGTNISFIPNGGGTPVFSIVYSGSLETDNKLSLFSDIEVMLKGKLSFNGEYYNNLANTEYGKITGQTPAYLIIKYGAQYRFIKKESTDNSKFVPFARFGLLYGIAFSADYKLRDANGNYISSGNSTPATPENESPFGLEIGGGATYYFTNSIGVKFAANYRQLFNINGIKTGNADNVFYPLKSHPGISISLKYRIFND